MDPLQGGLSAVPDLPDRLDVARSEVNMDVLDVGRVLVQAISDLKRIRDELGHRDVRELTALLSITEDELRRKAEAVLSSSADGGRLVNEISELELVHRTTLVTKPRMGRTYGRSVGGPRASARTSRRARPSEKQRARISKNLLAHPGTDAARALLQDRYGIEGTATTAGLNMRTVGGARAGLLYPHKTSLPSRVLAKEVRENPLASAPLEVIDAELHKGLHHLLNKGIIPTNQDLSEALLGDSAPVQTLPATIRRFEDKFRRAPITTALEDHALASQNVFKERNSPLLSSPLLSALPMDLMTPTTLTTWEEAESAPQLTAAGEDEGEEAQTRAYTELMDQYSLHEFLIRRGSTVDTTPEFLSFHRTYADHWPPIAELVLQLEGICAQYAVPLAIINGKMLADLSTDSMTHGAEPVPMEDLLGCIKNIQQVAAVLQQPGRRYKGPGGDSEAAVRIQSVFRGRQARQRLQQLKREAAAALEIQQAWGNHKERQKTLARIVEAKEERERQFQALQKWLGDYWEAIEGSQHVVVHVPSLTMTPTQKLGLSRFQARQNTQMSRICDVADPLVDVVYVAPFQLGDDVDGYWNKLLEVGGVEHPSSRCRIVYPENYERLPMGMSLSAQLLSSPRALKRIRAHVKGRPAYIVPGHIGEDEKDLAVALGLPLLAPHPGTVATLSRKSAARTIFMEAKMNVPPGRTVPPMLKKDSPMAKLQREKLHGPGSDPEKVVSQSFKSAEIVAWTKKGGAQTQEQRLLQEIVATLAELIVTHPMVVRWIFKIDDAFGGRGHCHLDLVGLPGVEQALDRIVMAKTATQGQSSTLLAIEEDMWALSLQEVKESLTVELPRNAVIACQETFPKWKDYLLGLGDRGGVVEACPRQVTGSPSANIFIDPLGECSVLSTQEQIFCPAYRYIGASFPQSSVPHAALCDAAISVGKAAYSAGIIGHVGVDFVAHREDGLLRLWAVDLNIACTSTLSNFQLFDFLSAGEIDLRQGSYFVPEEGVSEEDIGSDEEEYKGEAFQRRFFTTVDFLSHKGLSSMQYASFFNKCRLNGLAFDMQDRLGTVFNVMDSFASGVLGIISVGRSAYESFAEVSEVLQFMSKELGPRGMEGEGDEQGFRNVYATFKYLTDRLRPPDA